MKKIKKISAFATLATGLLFATSCQDKLQEANINPNSPEDANPSYVLTNMIKVNVTRYWDVEANMDGGLLIAQHWAKIQYTDEDRYRFRTTSYQNIWNGFYAQGLQDAKDLMALGEKTGNSSYTAVAQIMRSWLFMLLTDTYGQVPYTEALKLSENVGTPAYDSQETIYLGLLAELKQASETLGSSSPSIGGDILYSGDLTKWKRFANSLRMRIALRIADQKDAEAKAVFADLAAKGWEIFKSNADNASLAFQASPSQNPIALNRETRDDHRISKTMVDKLLALGDPRLSIYADKTADASVHTVDNNGYIGVPNGLLAADANALGLSKTSKVGKYFLDPKAPGVIMTYSEVLFDLAEAAERGYASTGVAPILYNQAVTASMHQYGITDAAAISTYLAQTPVVYNPANWKKSIGEQKWIALYGQGMEAFAEWRRLDYPVLTPAVAGVLSGAMPVRFRYPGLEQSLNKASYQKAVQSQGSDALTTKLWFDKF